MKKLKITIICGLLFALIPALGSLIFNFGNWGELGIISLFGLFLGLIAAPEIEPKAFKNAALFQTSSGILSGILLAIFLGGTTEIIVLLSLVGGILGWSAPFWVKHVRGI